MTRHEIQILRAVGMAQTAAAAKTDVSVRSVRRIQGEEAVTDAGTTAMIRARGVGRPSIAAAWTDTVAGWLREEREFPSGEIVRRLREDHRYRGGKSVVYELIRRLRPVPTAPLVRFEGVPGEFSQHDFGMVTARFTNDTTARVRFFASRLKWSRFVHVTIVPDEREEALVRGLLQAFEVFGGVPLVTVWDNPKTVVLKRKGDLIVWNPVFGQVVLDYRFAPELCWPRAGQQKGAVENLVGWVKKSFFTCRRFHDHAELEWQLTEWLRVVNTERPSRATGVIPAVRLAEERARLRPLPIPARGYALKKAVVVSARARVTHAGHEYSMPPATIGQAATLHRYGDHVEILPRAGAVVRHPRTAATPVCCPSTGPPCSRACAADAVGCTSSGKVSGSSGPTPKPGSPNSSTAAPAQWRHSVEDCFTLLQDYGVAPVRHAFAWGVAHGAIGSEYVRTQLARTVAAGA